MRSKLWRGTGVKFSKPVLLRTMNSVYTWWPVLHVALLVLVLSEAVAATTSYECHCDEGCFEEDGGRNICCTDLCYDTVALNNKKDCDRKCPHYEHFTHVKEKMKSSEQKCEGEVKHWKAMYTEMSKKFETMYENYNASSKEEHRLRKKLRDVESSGKLISGLATPLCLFGGLIVVLVVCACLYQNSEVCKKQPRITRDEQDCLNENDYSSNPSSLDMKPAALDSASQSRMEKPPPEYRSSVSGVNVGRVSPRHSNELTGVILPCVGCAPSPPTSYDAYVRAAANQQQQQQQQHNLAISQHLLHQQQTLPKQYQQQQPQLLQQQQQQQVHPQLHVTCMGSNGAACLINNNNMVANQLPTHPTHQLHDMAVSNCDTDQARKNEKNVNPQKMPNDPESCAFRLADLDFANKHYPESLSKFQQKQRRTMNSNNSNNSS